MSIHKGQVLEAEFRQFLRAQSKGIDPWLCSFPNVADFNFNYAHLLNLASQNGIAKNTNLNFRVGVVGLGVAGLLAARELYRSGYTNIDLFEATDRIAGRTYSIPANDQYTTFEMGAMRMPFFTEPGSGQCILDYLTSEFGLTLQDFPDPGSPVANTGIFINEGYGPDAEHPFEQPQLLQWRTQGQQPPPPPPTEKLSEIYAIWANFSRLFQTVASQLYASEQWEPFWKDFVNYYWNMNFRELVTLEAVDHYDPDKRGYFGGLGMNQEQAQLFYTIGAGDGSWGAFYQIGCLYPVRTLLFGFATNHKLIQGRFNADGSFAGGPYAGQAVTDSLGNRFQSPTYLGVQSYGECLMFRSVSSANPDVDGYSLYNAVHSESHDINLYTSTRVNRVTKNPDGSITVGAGELQRTYDALVLTPPTWAMQLSIEFENFDFESIPMQVKTALKSSHWITSCKVFFSLKERYWEQTDIPQLISTDTFLQGVYGYGLDIKDAAGKIVRKDPGVLLVSYTWEDDANKFLPELENRQLAQLCIEKLDSILLSCENIKQPISPFVNLDEVQVIHWSQQPDYRGCAKLYRQSTWDENYNLLSYNQKYSSVSGLYFAGEAFSLEGGWTEPALRYALDATLYIVKNSGGEFLNGFDFELNYPKHDDWSPVLPGEELLSDAQIEVEDAAVEVE